MGNSSNKAQNSQPNANGTASDIPTYEQATNSAGYSPPTSHPVVPTPVVYINTVANPQQQEVAQSNSQQVVVIQQHTLTPFFLGSEPAYVLCPACHVQRVTRIERVINSSAHMAALLLCLTGFWCCIWIPYVFETCKNTEHYCGNCNQYLGTVRR